jgi:hypothetical protein
MRSVVVVLPASMWAMMPMLRTLVEVRRGRLCATGFVFWSSVAGADAVGRRGTASDCAGALQVTQRQVVPAVVREGLVGLGHLVGVLAALDRGAEAVGGVEDLVGMRRSAMVFSRRWRGVADQPAQARVLARRA